MVSLWPWKGEDNSPSSFEKTLSTLSTKTASTSTRLDSQRQQARRFKALWTLYSIFIYILYTTIDVLVLGWQSWGPWEYGAVLGGPFVIYFVRTVASRIFDYRIQRTQSHLDHLIKQRDETIEKLKVATKYNSTQELLEKYGGVSPSSKSKAGGKNAGGGSKKKDNNNNAGAPGQQQQQQQVVARTGIPPPPTANIRRRPQNMNNEGPSSPPQAPPAYNSPDNYLQGKPLPPPPPPGANYIDQPGFAPNAFPAPSQAQYDKSGGMPRWYDRLMDVLLGEDETSPKNRFVLICQNCRLVNGQVPPGVKSLGELGRWRCGGCGAWNGEESEAKKVIEEIQRVESVPTTDQESNKLHEDDDDDAQEEGDDHERFSHVKAESESDDEDSGFEVKEEDAEDEEASEPVEKEDQPRKTAGKKGAATSQAQSGVSTRSRSKNSKK